MESATIALGWFWNPEFDLRNNNKKTGVLNTVVGYAGGEELCPNNENIKDYTEAVQVHYNP